MRTILQSSGYIDTRKYEDPLLLAKFLMLLDGKITDEEKDILKSHFLIKDSGDISNS